MKKMKKISRWQLIAIGVVISTVITLTIDYLFPTAWNIRDEFTWIKVFFAVLLYAFNNVLIL